MNLDACKRRHGDVPGMVALEDAPDGYVLRDRDGDVWFCASGGLVLLVIDGEAQACTSCTPWRSAELEVAEEKYGPFVLVIDLAKDFAK